ncbi:hypothetical protein [Streptomyces brasiliscabiei]|uniref:hypothetical protein n=1 Tax=Streptomyces brasiliscabiei TaxID=2736302 RepID=UPI001C10F282|nr:hypothetical protein [Streptomyces brasiliscabiei]
MSSHIDATVADGEDAAAYGLTDAAKAFTERGLIVQLAHCPVSVKGAAVRGKMASRGCSAGLCAMPNDERCRP